MTKTDKKGGLLHNLLIFLLMEIGFLIMAYVCVYFLWTNFTTRDFFWNTALLQNKTFHLLCIVLSLILLAVIAWTLIKYNIISFSNIINKVSRAQSDAFGSTRWQSDDEVKENYGDYSFAKLGEIEAEGYVISSRWKKNEITVSMVPRQHNLVVGTSGTGKSYYYLGPTIQANAKSKTKSSMVINDLKGELYAEHSKMLAEEGYDVIKIDLRNPHTSDRYNPLSLIWDLYHEYIKSHDGRLIDRVSVYINEIASILCPIGHGDQQQWSQGAQSIIKSIIWALLEDSGSKDLKMTRDKFTILQISNIANRQKPYLMDFLTHRARTSPVFDYAGMILDNPSEKTVGSYYATLSTALESFLEPGLQKVTSDTDIDITQLASKPTAVFIIIPDELKSRNIVGTMIVSQIYNYLTFEASQLPGEKLEKSVYFLLDEFGNLPIIPNFPSWVALGRSRGIFFNVIIQADSQLHDVYGQNGAKTIIQNCHLQILLGASEIETLKRFEDLFGKFTIYQRSANIDQTNASLEYKGSTGLTSKDLITLDQLQRMNRGDIYFKILGDFPCRQKLIPLFEEKAQGIFKRGSLSGKTDSGKAKEIDKESTYYDLAVREARYKTAKRGTGERAIEEEEELDISKFNKVRVDAQLFEQMLEPMGIDQYPNSYNGENNTLIALVPSDKSEKVAQIIKKHLTDAAREEEGIERISSNAKKNASLFDK